MNKQELVAQIAGKVGITKKDTANAVDAFIETVTDTLSRGEKVTLVGFGTFQVMQRKARIGRNPQTGEKIQILARKVPRFRPGKNLMQKVS